MGNFWQLTFFVPKKSLISSNFWIISDFFHQLINDKYEFKVFGMELTLCIIFVNWKYENSIVRSDSMEKTNVKRWLIFFHQSLHDTDNC